VVITGDFNLAPSTPGIKNALTEWHDTWTMCHPAGDPGWTYPADVPNSKIDYIFVKSENMRCIQSEVVVSEASDHRPVVTTLGIMI